MSLRSLALVLPLLLLAALLACSRPVTLPSSNPAPAASGPAMEIPEAACPVLDSEGAAELVSLALACVEKEYPNKPDLMLVGDENLKPPRVLWPSFYGCYDWHSSVHGHWSMVRVLKLFPDVPRAAEMRAILARHFATSQIQAEMAYFTQAHTRLFERPYGWAWFLRLQEELHTWSDPEAREWAENLKPLSELLATQTIDYLGRLSVPLRAGTHGNTAYALAHMLDYARAVGDENLETAIVEAARRFYLADTQCPTAYEPSGEDFISPCLVEADLMRRVLDVPEFREWLDGFLPPVESPRFAPLRAPVEVRDPEDPRIGHLIGLSLQRAASYRALSAVLPVEDVRRSPFRKMAELHCADGLARMADSGYGGEHWLASFAFYMLTDVGIAGD